MESGSNSVKFESNGTMMSNIKQEIPSSSFFRKFSQVYFEKRENFHKIQNDLASSGPTITKAPDVHMPPKQEVASRERDPTPPPGGLSLSLNSKINLIVFRRRSSVQR